MTTINLTRDEGSPLALSPQDLVGRRCAVLGASGYGKTNSVAVLIEELAPYIPMTIIDPEGEMWSLREKIDFVIVGKSENVDIEIGPHQAAPIATWSVEHGVNIILDLFDYEDETVIHEITENYVRALLEACKRKKRPYQLIVEEAHMFMPEPMPRNSIWKQIARRGRKMGIGVILASQRSQNIDKDMLTQAQFCILHYVSHPRDRKVYKELIPESSRKVEGRIDSLRVGHAVIVDDGKLDQVEMRLRDTYHPSSTPQIFDEDTDSAGPNLRSVDSDTIAALQKLAENAGPPPEDPVVKKIRKERDDLREQNEMADGLIADLTKKVEEYEAHVDKLTERIEVLRLIKVEVQMLSPQGEPVPVAAGAENQPHPPRRRKSGSPAVFQRRMLDVDTTMSSDMLINRQKEELERCIKYIKGQPKQDKLLLRYLIESGDTVALDAIATQLAYAENTLKSNPPTGLMHKGIIERTGKRPYKYWFSTKKFPHLDEAIVKADLLAALPTQ